LEVELTEPRSTSCAIFFAPVWNSPFRASQATGRRRPLARPGSASSVRSVCSVSPSTNQCGSVPPGGLADPPPPGRLACADPKLLHRPTVLCNTVDRPLRLTESEENMILLSVSGQRTPGGTGRYLFLSSGLLDNDNVGRSRFCRPGSRSRSGRQLCWSPRVQACSAKAVAGSRLGDENTDLSLARLPESYEFNRIPSRPSTSSPSRACRAFSSAFMEGRFFRGLPCTFNMTDLTCARKLSGSRRRTGTLRDVVSGETFHLEIEEDNDATPPISSRGRILAR
jgi:hypothetical protein